MQDSLYVKVQTSEKITHTKKDYKVKCAQNKKKQ